MDRDRRCCLRGPPAARRLAASEIWADAAYRSVANEAFLAKSGFVRHIHRKKPKGRTMPKVMRRMARQLNERLRKTLTFETPAERFRACVTSTG